MNNDDDYDQACTKCEHAVVLSRASRDHLVALLDYGRRPGGACGRALRASVPELGLLHGDRLEPSWSLPDVGKLEELSSFPAAVTF